MSPVPIMAPVYSGSLQPKKKYELQEIALALRLSGQGTKDDLVQRITKHLDMRQDELEEHPTFTGLYSRRKRSVQPQPLLRCVEVFYFIYNLLKRSLARVLRSQKSLNRRPVGPLLLIQSWKLRPLKNCEPFLHP